MGEGHSGKKGGGGGLSSLGPAATESMEQQCLMKWTHYNLGRWPQLRLLYHIPNEGRRSQTTGGRLKAEGMKRGVPDLCLPVAKGGWHALYIELKRRDGGRVSQEQKEWLDALAEAGNRAVICRGWEEAAQEIEAYLRMPEPDWENRRTLIIDRADT